MPAVITVPYVNNVLAQLNRVYSAALKTSLETRSVNSQVKTDLRAIYADPLYSEEVRGFELQLEHLPNDLRSPLGNRVTTVVKLISASRSCIFVSTKEDFSKIVSNPGPRFGSEYYSLVPRKAKDDPDHLNPTPWQFGYNLASIGTEIVNDQCPSGDR